MFAQRLLTALTHPSKFIEFLGQYHDACRTTFDIPPLSPGKRMVALAKALNYTGGPSQLKEEDKAARVSQHADDNTICMLRIPVHVITVREHIDNGTSVVEVYTASTEDESDKKLVDVFEHYCMHNDTSAEDLIDAFGIRDELDDEDVIEEIGDIENNSDIVEYIKSHHNGWDLVSKLPELMYQSVFVDCSLRYIDHALRPTDLTQSPR